MEKAWEKAGLIPFQPEVVLNKVQKRKKEPQPISRPSSLGSSLSALSDFSSKRLKRAFTRVAGKSATARDPKVKQLIATIEHLSAKNTLLENEMDGLKQALAQEKQKRKKAKLLKSYLHEKDDQAAIIFLP